MRKKIISVACLFFYCVSNIQAQQKPAAITVNNGIERPRLVVGLVIDQMRWDYLYRYFNRYGNGGFKKLLQKGYSYENTFIPYAAAVTGAGHSCLYTGSIPAINGIVGNDWIERNTGQHMYCTDDKSVNTIGSFSNQGQMSPRNLLVTTVGDELRLATNFKSRVFGIALKDRGGILPAGHSANAAYWFDDSTGNWITSSYYMKKLPAWVNNYNKSRKADSMMMKDWNLLYNSSLYDQSTTDDNYFEKPLYHETTVTFPHSYKTQIGKNYLPFRQSPYGNTLTIDLAEKLISNERMGMSGQTDMICVSLSSTDYIGHRFGPNSLEVEDTYLRLDKDIEQFLNYLDVTIGNGNYLLFLSADHGAPQVPAFMKENKLPGGNLNASDLLTELNRFCFSSFGHEKIVSAIYEYQVYLDTKLIDSLKLDAAEIKKSLVNFLKLKPEVMNAFDYADLDKLVLPAQIKDKFERGYFFKRSGDIQFVLRSQYTDVLMTGTEHGTMYSYDAHIPLLWYGWKIRPGKTNREVYMTDVAPTISAMLKIQMPGGSVGHVLQEVVN